jgi:flagellar biosynthetic protein FliR
MPASLTLSAGTLFAFLLVLARMSGALVFVPMPGLGSTPGPVRAVLSFVFTLALVSRWPAVDAGTVTVGRLAVWAVAEAAIGVAIGVCLAIVLEAFSFAAQVLGLPAGYGYASTVDPNTQADAGILLVLAQLIAGMLFFALGLDREVLRLFASSLDRVPAGGYVFGVHSADAMIRLSGNLLSVGTRLALPVVALLVMVDIAMALMGRLNAQLQLLSLSFPAKMLTALLVLSWSAALYPRILLSLAGEAMGVARRILGI